MIVTKRTHLFKQVSGGQSYQKSRKYSAKRKYRKVVQYIKRASDGSENNSSLFIIGHVGLFFYTKKRPIISTVDLPTTEIIESILNRVNTYWSISEMKTVANLIVATVFIYWVIGFLSDCWLTSQPIDCVLFIIMVK